MAVPTTILQLRLPMGLGDAVKAIAGQQGISMNSFAVKAVLDAVSRSTSPRSKDTEAPDAGDGPVLTGPQRRV